MTGSPATMEKINWVHNRVYYVKRSIWQSAMAMFGSVIVWFIMRFLISVFERSSDQHVDVIDIVLAFFFLLCLVILIIFLIISTFLDTYEAIKDRTITKAPSSTVATEHQTIDLEVF